MLAVFTLLATAAPDLGDDAFAPIDVGMFRDERSLTGALPDTLRARCTSGVLTSMLSVNVFVLPSSALAVADVLCVAGDKTQDRLGLIRFHDGRYSLELLSLHHAADGRLLVQSVTPGAGKGEVVVEAEWIGDDTTIRRRLTFAESGNLLREEPAVIDPKKRRFGGQRDDTWMLSRPRIRDLGADAFSAGATAVDDAALLAALPQTFRDRCGDLVGWGLAVKRPLLTIVRHGDVSASLSVISLRCGAMMMDRGPQPESISPNYDERVALLRRAPSGATIEVLAEPPIEENFRHVHAQGSITVGGARIAMFDLVGIHNPCCDGPVDRTTSYRLFVDESGATSVLPWGFDYESGEDNPFRDNATVMRTEIHVDGDGVSGTCTTDELTVRGEEWNKPPNFVERRRSTAHLAGSWDASAHRMSLVCDRPCGFALWTPKRSPLQSPCERVTTTASQKEASTVLPQDTPMPERVKQ
jgi:hypothetical protein